MPPLYFFQDMSSDEEMMHISGNAQFRHISGMCSDEVAIDYNTSYGYILQRARTWVKTVCPNSAFFALIFPAYDGGNRVIVHSEEEAPNEVIEDASIRQQLDAVRDDYVGHMNPDCIPITIQSYTPVQHHLVVHIGLSARSVQLPVQQQRACEMLHSNFNN